MKNIKRLIIIAIIIILLIIAIVITLNKKDNNVYPGDGDINYLAEEFIIDNESKYKVVIKKAFKDINDQAPKCYKTSYYQIDIEKNIVEYREDHMPIMVAVDEELSTEYYEAKLVDQKELSIQESNKLKQILDKVIKEGKTKFENDGDFKRMNYYCISNPGESSIVMDNVEDISKFEEIIDF